MGSFRSSLDFGELHIAALYDIAVFLFELIIWSRVNHVGWTGVTTCLRKMMFLKIGFLSSKKFKKTIFSHLIRLRTNDQIHFFYETMKL